MEAFLGAAAGRLGEDPASFLDAGGKVLAEYIWLGCTGSDLRNKTRVLDAKPEAPEDCPVIVVDANPLGLAGIEDTEVYLKPRKIFRDPFRGGDHILVLCDTFQPPQVALDRPDAVQPTLQPHPSNTRAACDHVVRQAHSADPMFAVEQEYVVEGSGKDNTSDFGFATGAELSIPGAAFLPGSAISALNRCVRPSAATRAAAARQMSDAHLRQCLYAGINIRGATQLSSAAGIWSYKVGPCRGVDAADQLWMSRYLLLRLSEQQGLGVSFEPSLKDGSSCTGCCVKYSTEATRDPECGLGVIQEHIARLEGAHLQHVVVYGRGTLQRLVSNNLSHFAYAVGSKPACITIPTTTVLNRSGYYVDRRPSSNMDPYVVTMLLVATTEDIPVPVMGPAQQHQQQRSSMQTGYPASAPQQSSLSCFKNNQRCSAPVPTGSNPFGAKAAARQIAAFGGRGSFSHLSSYHGVAGSPLEAGVLCGAVNASWCSAPRPTCSYNTGATSGVTMNTEDVLLDELDRIDGFAPDTPPNNQFSLTSACASSDECCSDGTSPERPCPLLQVGSVPMQYELLW